MSPSVPDRPNFTEARALTEAITRLRRVLRTSIRTDYPWETLPMAQVELLMALREQQPVSIGQLATQLRLAPNTVSGLVQQLVVAGLALRQPSQVDRRAALVTVTEAGLAQLAAWDRAHQQRIGAALARLPASERDAVCAALPALAHLVDYLSSPRQPAPRATQQCPDTAVLTRSP